MNTVVAIRKTDGQVSDVQLSTGSILTRGDLESSIEAGIEFQTQDAAGNTSRVVVVVVEGEKHIRTARNDVVSDNLGNLPLFG
jgi:hypothetical protein